MNPLSGVFEEAWRIYRAHSGHLLAIAFIIYIVTAVIVGLLALTGTYLGLFLGVIVELFATFLLQATLIKAVQDVRDGRADLSIGETTSAAAPYVLPVAAASILAGIAITIALFLLIVPGLILITIWALFIPVIVLERSGALASFGRSQQLVRGNGWPVFGTLVVLFIIQIFVTVVLRIIFFALPVLVRNSLSTVIAGTLVAPLIAVTVTLIYYRLSGQEAPAGVPGGPGAAGWQGGPAGGPYGGTAGGPAGGPYGGPAGGPYGGPAGGPAGGSYGGPPPANPYGGTPPGNPYGTPPSNPGGSSDWFGGSSAQ